MLTTLAVSGRPSDRFTFEGFLPRKHGERMQALREVATERRTMVFFESPNRLAASLTDLAAVLGAERSATLADAVLAIDATQDVSSLMRLATPLMPARLAGE